MRPYWNQNAVFPQRLKWETFLSQMYNIVFVSMYIVVLKYWRTNHYDHLCCRKQQGVTIVKPIVFGNVARYFGKKREEDGHTHQWSVYVKPYRNEVRYLYT